MPSTERSLVQRVGLAAASSAAVASLATLAVAMLVVDYRVTKDAEGAALARADAFIRELDAEVRLHGRLDRALVEEEVAEFTHGGVSIAVFGPSGRVAGAASVPDVARDGCATVPGETDEWLACRASATGTDGWVVVGEPRSSLLAHRKPLLVGGLAALLVVAFGGVVAGWVVGRWSLRPLVDLRAAIDGVPVAARGDAPPMPRSGLVELDALARTLDGLLGRLHAELERSRRFAAAAAHELRTPLTKLRTELELLGEEVADGPERATLLRQVARTEELARLVDRLLVLASPEGSLRGASLVSISALVETHVEDLDAPGRVRLHLEDDGMVVGDASVLAAVVSNAIGNALKFSDGPVRVSVVDVGEDVVLRVDDEGPGLRAEDRERAFDGFFRAPEHRATAGHGIGLALIAHVVGAHGGSARFVEGPPGAHLAIRLPRHRGGGLDSVRVGGA